MKVKELIELLRNYDENKRVVIGNHGWPCEIEEVTDNEDYVFLELGEGAKD